MTKKEIGQALKKLRLESGMSRKEVSDITGRSISLIGHWETGYSQPDADTFITLCNLYGGAINEVFGFDTFKTELNKPKELYMSEQIRPISTQRVPLLGNVAAGQPILATEDFECYIEIGTDIKCDFCLRVNGDSMINARINDGDIVFVRQQPDVNDGEIGVVLIDNDATLKRVYKNNGSITLVAENTKYKPIVISGKDTIDVRILGKAVAFQSDVK